MIWEEILLYSLLFFLLLHILGHPVLRYLERIKALDSSLSNLDFVQRLPLEFVLGGVIIYVWALIATPFRLFNSTFAWALTIVFGIWYAVAEIRRRTSFNFRMSPYSLAAIAIFLLALFLRIVPLSSFALGSVPDTSFHTLIVYSVIRDSGIPLSVIPGTILQVPAGVHVVMAYFTFISGLTPELVTFYELAYFNATIILIVYCFSTLLVSREFALIVELLLTGISLYPIAITWGAQWIPWGLTIFFAFVILITPTFLHKDLPANQKFRTLVTPGIVLGYLGSTYPPLYALSVVIILLLIFFERNYFVRKISSLGTLVLISLPLVAIWIFRLIVYSNYLSPFLLQEQQAETFQVAYNAAFRWLPYRNMITPSGFTAPIYNWFTWQIQVGWPSSYFFVILMVIGSGLFTLILLSKNRVLLPKNLRIYVAAVFVTVLIWGLISPLGLFYSPSGALGILASELDKAAVLAGVILLPFIVAVPLYLFVSLFGQGKILKLKHKRLISRGIIVGLMLANLVVIPSGLVWLTGNYNAYAVSSNDDYKLLLWMKTGIPNNAIVLVNPLDAGQYVPSIANKSTMGMYSGVLFLDQNYEKLWQLLVNNVMNATTFNLIEQLNINYIFVGSRAVQGGWSAELFFSNSYYFQVEKNFGLSFLFKVMIPPHGPVT